MEPNTIYIEKCKRTKTGWHLQWVDAGANSVERYTLACDEKPSMSKPPEHPLDLQLGIAADVMTELARLLLIHGESEHTYEVGNAAAMLREWRTEFRKELEVK